MKLTFNPEAKVTEFNNGFYFKNEGQPIEVDARVGKALLKKMHEVAPRQFVNIFVEAVESKPKQKAKAEEKEIKE